MFTEAQLEIIWKGAPADIGWCVHHFGRPLLITKDKTSYRICKLVAGGLKINALTKFFDNGGYWVEKQKDHAVYKRPEEPQHRFNAQDVVGSVAEKQLIKFVRGCGIDNPGKKARLLAELRKRVAINASGDGVVLNLPDLKASTIRNLFGWEGTPEGHNFWWGLNADLPHLINLNLIGFGEGQPERVQPEQGQPDQGHPAPVKVGAVVLNLTADDLKGTRVYDQLVGVIDKLPVNRAVQAAKLGDLVRRVCINAHNQRKAAAHCRAGTDLDDLLHWVLTPEGHDFWSDIYLGRIPRDGLFNLPPKAAIKDFNAPELVEAVIQQAVPVFAQEAPRPVAEIEAAPKKPAPKPAPAPKVERVGWWQVAAE